MPVVQGQEEEKTGPRHTEYMNIWGKGGGSSLIFRNHAFSLLGFSLLLSSLARSIPTRCFRLAPPCQSVFFPSFSRKGFKMSRASFTVEANFLTFAAANTTSLLN